jgi:DNA primase
VSKNSIPQAGPGAGNKRKSAAARTDNQLDGYPVWAAELAAIMQLRELTARESSKKLVVPTSVPRLLIPYFTPEGERTSYFRLRAKSVPATGFGKLTGATEPKYLSAKGSGVHIYYPVGGQQCAPAAPLVITEGEAKAASLVQAGIGAVGLGGVSMWRGETPGSVHPDLLTAAARHGNAVVICFDADLATNPDVAREEYKLAAALAAAGVTVQLARLPQGEFGKVDDYLRKYGTPALLKLLAAAQPLEVQQELDKLNREFGHCRQTATVIHLGDRHALTLKEFVGNYADRTVTTNNTGKPREENAATVWLRSKWHFSFRGQEYLPGGAFVTSSGALNRWKSRVVEPVPGDVSPWLAALENVAPEFEDREFLLNWLAAPMQTPGLKQATAIVLYSPIQGVGKSTMISGLQAIYGENMKVVNNKALHSQFNAHIVDSELVVGEEIMPAKDTPTSKELLNSLKTLITESIVRVERKKIEAHNARSFCNFIFTTNHANSFSIDKYDRRMAIIASDREKLDKAVRTEYQRWLDSGGAAHLYDYLLRRDISAYNPHGHAPMNAAKEQMAELGRSQIEQFAYDLAHHPDMYPGRVRTFMTNEELFDVSGLDPNKYSAKAMANALTAEGFKQVAHGRPQTRVRTTSGVVTAVRLWLIKPGPMVATLNEAATAHLYEQEKYGKTATTGSLPKYRKSLVGGAK